MTPSSGTATSSSEDSRTSWFSASTMPPIHMIGADSNSVNVMRASIWTCWTSLVVRVISDGVPKWVTSRSENRCTRPKMPCRTSRPSAIATLAPKYTAPTAHRICASVMASIRPPTCRM